MSKLYDFVMRMMVANSQAEEVRREIAEIEKQIEQSGVDN